MVDGVTAGKGAGAPRPDGNPCDTGGTQWHVQHRVSGIAQFRDGIQIRSEGGASTLQEDGGVSHRDGTNGQRAHSRKEQSEHSADSDFVDHSQASRKSGDGMPCAKHGHGGTVKVLRDRSYTNIGAIDSCMENSCVPTFHAFVARALCDPLNIILEFLDLLMQFPLCSFRKRIFLHCSSRLPGSISLPDPLYPRTAACEFCTAILQHFWVARSDTFFIPCSQLATQYQRSVRVWLQSTVSMLRNTGFIKSKGNQSEMTYLISAPF